MDKLLALIAQGQALVSNNYGVALTVLGVAFAVSKAVSNEKAGVVVSKIQSAFDVAAKGLQALGGLCASVAALLADVLKSDGLLGKK